MFAVTAENVIVFANSRDRADGDCFLSDVEVTEAADLAGYIHLRRLLFEAADKNHLTVEVDELFLFEATQAVFLAIFGLIALSRKLLFIDVVGWINNVGRSVQIRSGSRERS